MRYSMRAILPPIEFNCAAPIRTIGLVLTAGSGSTPEDPLDFQNRNTQSNEQLYVKSAVDAFLASKHVPKGDFEAILLIKRILGTATESGGRSGGRPSPPK